MNEDKTRTFVGLRVSPSSRLSALVAALDAALAEFSLPPFYDPPDFHISLLWCLGDKREEIAGHLQALERFRGGGHLEDGFDLAAVKCKCGNKVYSFPLATS